MAGQRGFCAQGATLRIALIEAHLGEEPPFSGRNGSGTVFFTGCSLRCSFCQNFQISRLGIGRTWSVKGAAIRILELEKTPGIHNVNLVTPDHFFPHTMVLIQELRGRGLSLPVLYNLSGYQRVDSLRLIESHADIYLPDFKYGDRKLAATLSRAEDYPAVALEAIAEMVRQKGFLDAWDHSRGIAHSGGDFPVATKGVLVRHLVLPGQIENSLRALTMLFLEFGRELPLSLMSQYMPVGKQPLEELQRTVSPQEFQRVLDHAYDLGFRRILYQPPQSLSPDPSKRPFLPDFTRKRPFDGNTRLAREHGGLVHTREPQTAQAHPEPVGRQALGTRSRLAPRYQAKRGGRS